MTLGDRRHMNFHDERDNLLREDAVLAAHEQAGGQGPGGVWSP